MSSYFHNREEDRDRSNDGSQYSSYGNGNVAPDWGSHDDTPEQRDEAPSRFYGNDRSPAWEQDTRQIETIRAENADLRRDLHRTQRIGLRLVDEQKESTERIRELQDKNYDLEEEVTNMRAQLSFATGSLINEIQDKVDAATFAGSTVHALKQQISEQTEIIENLKIQKRKAVKELYQLQLQRRKRKRSSKSTKSEKGKSGKRSTSSNANAAANTPSPISTLSQAPTLEPPGHEFESYVIEDIIRERLVVDEHLTVGVIAQFQQALSKRTNEGKNLYRFIHQGRNGRYYCFHEVCEKGPDAWVEQRLADPRCKLGSGKCNFLLKAVSVGSHRKLQIYNPAVGTSA
ncbi:hypothetical protein FGADI_3881 [Fusarium gaditjirri]|uniref:Uncharacterized protein n=1 Tax=Fusarium gaditjirri TaxID=282569 RepID=A0A8H4TEC4_9HYPO|nr:hypothetical protein FGADI_3881 [Fusarium gaditjirri]